MTAQSFLDGALTASFTLIALSLIFGFLRLVKGPSLSDRVVALDMMTMTVMAVAGLYSIYTGHAVFIDIAVVLALVGFLTTLALARFAERMRVRRDEQ